MAARPDQGFPVNCRLRNPREYTRVWRQGRRCHTDHFIVIALPGAGSWTRLGISVSRKVGNAVNRNRIKRWLREYFRNHRQVLTDGTDLSVIVKPGGAALGHEQFDRELNKALKHLKVIGNA